MPFRLATEPAYPGRDNEDFAAVVSSGAVLLDGASAPRGWDTGCSHGVAWYTRRLGGLLLANLDARLPLCEGLADAITTAASLHANTCDLTNQQTPSATVVMVRLAGTELEYLVLSDSALAVEGDDGAIEVITDGRMEDVKARVAAAERPDDRARAILSQRNVSGGFWTAGADPRAADEAITGTLPLAKVRAFAALSDGATRGIDLFASMTWEDCFDLIAEQGPHAVIDHVRQRERTDPDQVRFPRSKRCDDATVVAWTPA
ncbi:hypothetical protein BJF83_24120 [Nocardiopsis sp. CNR-923]|uniref:protein phosphatase 2C domain-containing protein n=1 Tax=Nocardiopsis sp. CNR-923 TaxID=1904965 RepID=UPI00095A57C2|nr:protein phosphatase 2C domain-containing protein [Nocardiopsis sp. CNR-923]OLT24464.1 hypothetical protein BJF83_24120 [Nocardiopsis sp. CNR-923]